MLVTASCGQVKVCELSIALHRLSGFYFFLHEGQTYFCHYFTDVGSLWIALQVQMNFSSFYSASSGVWLRNNSSSGQGQQLVLWRRPRPLRRASLMKTWKPSILAADGQIKQFLPIACATPHWERCCYVSVSDWGVTWIRTALSMTLSASWNNGLELRFL